jgi:hypothetical protein
MGYPFQGKIALAMHPVRTKQGVTATHIDFRIGKNDEKTIAPCMISIVCGSHL